MCEIRTEDDRRTVETLKSVIYFLTTIYCYPNSQREVNELVREEITIYHAGQL